MLSCRSALHSFGLQDLSHILAEPEPIWLPNERVLRVLLLLAELIGLHSVVC